MRLKALYVVGMVSSGREYILIFFQGDGSKLTKNYKFSNICKTMCNLQIYDSSFYFYKIY
jgi:hypothetical protein